MFVCLSNLCDGLGALEIARSVKKIVFVCLSNVYEGLGARQVLTSVLLWLFNVCAGLNAREVGDRLDA